MQGRGRGCQVRRRNAELKSVPIELECIYPREATDCLVRISRIERPQNTRLYDKLRGHNSTDVSRYWIMAGVLVS